MYAAGLTGGGWLLGLDLFLHCFGFFVKLVRLSVGFFCFSYFFFLGFVGFVGSKAVPSVSEPSLKALLLRRITVECPVVLVLPFFPCFFVFSFCSFFFL